VLTELLHQLYDPTSTNFHRYLTPKQFTEAFGPSERDYQAAVQFARANGLMVTATHSNRMLLGVRGSVSAIERALRVKMCVFPHPEEARTFYAPDTEPLLDLGTRALHISGLSNYRLPRPGGLRENVGSSVGAKPRVGSGPNGAFLGKDFRAAYV